MEKLGDAYMAQYVNPAPVTIPATATFTLASTTVPVSAPVLDTNRSVYYPDPLWWHPCPASQANWLSGAASDQASEAI